MLSLITQVPYFFAFFLLVCMYSSIPTYLFNSFTLTWRFLLTKIKGVVDLVSDGHFCLLCQYTLVSNIDDQQYRWQRNNMIKICIFYMLKHVQDDLKGSSIKYVRKIFRKTNISNPLIHTRTCAYQRVRNVSFSENFAYILNGWPL